MIDTTPRRKWRHLAQIVLFSALTIAVAELLIVGVPALFVKRAVGEGMTVRGALWGALAVAWVGVLVQALVRSREARGWAAYLLFGWIRHLRRSSAGDGRAADGDDRHT